MAINLTRVGKVWHARWTLDGTRVQKSTRETNRQRAEKIAERMYRDAALWARNGRVIPTLRELVAQWLTIHEASSSVSHLKNVGVFARLHLYDLADVPVDDLKTARVEAARAKHLETHEPGSANQWLKVLRLLCNWAVRRGTLPAMPFHVRILKTQKKPRTILPVKLAQQWLDAIDARAGDLDAIPTAVRLMLALGLREAETRTARWEWLDVERKLYTPGITKGREADPIPVPDWLMSHLMPKRQTSGLMIARPNGKPYGPAFTRASMLVVNTAVGAPHITPHRLRATFATLLSESGVPVQNIQRVLRHKSITTTAAYLEVDMNTVAHGQQRIAEKIGIRLHIPPSGAPMANSNVQAQP